MNENKVNGSKLLVLNMEGNKERNKKRKEKKETFLFSLFN